MNIDSDPKNPEQSTDVLPRVPGYALFKEIGHGSVGNVYAGIRSNGQEVSVKILTKDSTSNFEAFEREAKIGAKLEHPNIVPILDLVKHSGPHGPEMAIVMPLVKGRTLRELMDERDLTQEERDRYLLQMADATDFINDNNVLHRDLKPENVFITNSADRSVKKYSDKRNDRNVLVGDFGFSRDEKRTSESPPETTQSMTPDYVSPEQAREDEEIGDREVFQLAVIAFEMYMGEHIKLAKFQDPAIDGDIPSTPETPTMTAAHMASMDGLSDQAYKAVSKQYGWQFAGVLNKALRNNPDDRYKTAKEFAKELLEAKQTSHKAGDIVSFPEADTDHSYLITKVINSGSHGTVFEAVDYGHNIDGNPKADIALKQATDDTVEILEKEAKITAKLEHPYIQQVLNFGKNNYGEAFFAMKLSSGETLESLLNSNNVTREELLKYLTELASAVDYTNKKGVLHRDLKPSNILITNVDKSEDESVYDMSNFFGSLDESKQVDEVTLDDLRGSIKGNKEAEKEKHRDERHVLLTDFGVAFEAGMKRELTIDNEPRIDGTAGYQSPEQIQGTDTPGDSEEYAVALIAFRGLFEAEFPVIGSSSDDPEELTEYLKNTDGIDDTVKSFIESSDPKHAEELIKVFNKALAKDRMQRYKTATEFVIELKKVFE